MRETEAKRIVLVGGGHAHLAALRDTARLVAAGARVTLVAPGRFHWYSGMGPGLLSGAWEPADARLDVGSLVERGGGELLEGTAVSVDPAARRVVLSDGRSVSYDLASFNVGSGVPSAGLPGAERAVPVKPVEGLLRARAALLSAAPGRPFRVLVVGAGPAGVEVAGNAARLGRREGRPLEVTLAGAEPRLLPGAPVRASALAQRALERAGVRVVSGRRIVELEDGRARDDGGAEHPFDLALLALGVRPSPLFAGSGLPTDPDGALLVDEHLRSVGDPRLFGGGDCVALRGGRLDRVGVYAVREAPVLLENLVAAVKGLPLRTFRPQRRYLLILNLGDGTGLFLRGNLVWRGRAALWWKNRLDRSFMRRYGGSAEGA